MGSEGSKLSPPGKGRSSWPKRRKRALWKKQLSASKAAKRLKERKHGSQGTASPVRHIHPVTYKPGE
jgi:hypothetical protein